MTQSGDDRRRRDEDRAREDELDRSIKGDRGGQTGTARARDPQASVTVDLSSEIQDLDTQLEHLHALYRQFFSGVERRPPNEKRALLEARIQRLSGTSAIQPAQKFKWNTFQQKWNTYRELWERQIKKQEKS